jgi:hypothetical protein
MKAAFAIPSKLLATIISTGVRRAGRSHGVLDVFEYPHALASSSCALATREVGIHVFVGS